MEKSRMKNVVVLRNLPSNLIEEAFVVVKSKKVARSLEYIDIKNNTKTNIVKDDNYIVREAESVLSSYVKLVEKKENKNCDFIWKKRYKRLMFYSVVVSLFFLVSIFA